jgi:hypothetical protein
MKRISARGGRHLSSADQLREGPRDKNAELNGGSR